MAVLVWLLIPLFAVVGAAIWGSWVQRSKTIGDVAELAGYARFRDAMERAHPAAPDPAPLRPVAEAASAES
ncbi:hypothetical protein [Streptomyces sp. CC208A]|uniref:hypothetical protein n=1 Tax=Streptomyces sp. CC208A TaxID=3044573 RepID=UPI0024A86D72|nr:hypothetical protein [Streptomyces sp. CC208A]